MVDAGLLRKLTQANDFYFCGLGIIHCILLPRQAHGYLIDQFLQNGLSEIKKTLPTEDLLEDTR